MSSKSSTPPVGLARVLLIIAGTALAASFIVDLAAFPVLRMTGFLALGAGSFMTWRQQSAARRAEAA